MAYFAHYAQDGADASSRAVLALVQGLCANFEDVDSNVDSVGVSRWSNCREQGYVATVRPKLYEKDRPKQLNIAWFEHRNSDNICVVVWKQDTIDAPTIHDADFSSFDIYKDKYDVTESFNYYQHFDCAVFISKQINTYLDLANRGISEEYEITY